MGRLDAEGRFVSDARVDLTVEGAIAVLTLCNPPVNAIDIQLVRQVEAALDHVEARGDVRALIVTAAGSAMFSAGSDLLEVSTLLGPRRAVQRKLGLQFRVFGRLAELPIPTIAALNGHALGGGLEVAVCCDLIVAEEQALLGSPEIRVGLFPSSGGTFRVARRIGPGRAKELQLLGEPITAEQARSWGLVNRVVPAGGGRAAALAWAEVLVERPVIGLAAVKALVDSAGDLPESESVRRSLGWSERAFASADGTEGVTAFLAKRPARFGGRAVGSNDRI